MTNTTQRVVAIDLLRGLAMIVMALDHVRNYFAASGAPPEDLANPGLALFFTRWITHFCAPVFVFLAGTSAWLNRSNNAASDTDLRRFLLSRGLWLVFAEFLLVNPLWPLWLDGYLLAQVIWAIGWSMIALGLALPLGARAILALGLVIVFAHNTLDGIAAATLGAFAPLWTLLHQEGVIELGKGWRLYAAYPVLPWIGVMMIGYGSGRFITHGNWQRVALRSGAAAVVLFVLLRVMNLYGDPDAFHIGKTAAQTIINFLNVQKYPPSLQYLLMTLGPALLLMPALEKWRSRVASWITVFGRVPFFYYVLHFALIYALAIGWSLMQFGEAFWWFRGEANFPATHSLQLWRAYAVWAVVVFALYPACRWYADFKRRRRDLWWLSYA